MARSYKHNRIRHDNTLQGIIKKIFDVAKQWNITNLQLMKGTDPRFGKRWKNKNPDVEDRLRSFMAYFFQQMGKTNNPIEIGAKSENETKIFEFLVPPTQDMALGSNLEELEKKAEEHGIKIEACDGIWQIKILPNYEKKPKIEEIDTSADEKQTRRDKDIILEEVEEKFIEICSDFDPDFDPDQHLTPVISTEDIERMLEDISYGKYDLFPPKINVSWQARGKELRYSKAVLEELFDTAVKLLADNKDDETYKNPEIWIKLDFGILKVDFRPPIEGQDISINEKEIRKVLDPLLQGTDIWLETSRLENSFTLCLQIKPLKIELSEVTGDELSELINAAANREVLSLDYGTEFKLAKRNLPAFAEKLVSALDILYIYGKKPIEVHSTRGGTHMSALITVKEGLDDPVIAELGRLARLAGLGFDTGQECCGGGSSLYTGIYATHTKHYRNRLGTELDSKDPRKNRQGES